jgi:dsDNA-specific endonuclease/ATPase MutS2
LDRTRQSQVALSRRIRDDRDVALPVSELSSVAAALEDLTKRVAEIANRASDEHDEASTELFAAERALRGAQRRIAKLASPSRRG